MGLVVSFGFIRLSTRLMRSPKVPWWPGSVVSESGVHVHHLVFGIVLMMLAGTISFAGFAVSPIYEICAFGLRRRDRADDRRVRAAGCYLDDVYWAKQGRSSIDATVIAVGFLGLVLIGTRPFDIDTDSTLTVIASVVSILLALSWVVIALLKGRVLHAAVGFFLFPFSLYASCRIAKPTSWWAKRFYGERNPRKQAKAEGRFPMDRRTERFKETVRDIDRRLARGGLPREDRAPRCRFRWRYRCRARLVAGRTRSRSRARRAASSACRRTPRAAQSTKKPEWIPSSSLDWTSARQQVVE